MNTSRKQRCHDDCAGWVPGDDGVERCDECAFLNGYEGDITDADVAALPEVRKASHFIYVKPK